MVSLSVVSSSIEFRFSLVNRLLISFDLCFCVVRLLSVCCVVVCSLLLVLLFLVSNGVMCWWVCGFVLVVSNFSVLSFLVCVLLLSVRLVYNRCSLVCNFGLVLCLCVVLIMGCDVVLGCVSNVLMVCVCMVWLGDCSMKLFVVLFICVCRVLFSVRDCRLLVLMVMGWLVIVFRYFLLF